MGSRWNWHYLLDRRYLLWKNVNVVAVYQAHVLVSVAAELKNESGMHGLRMRSMRLWLGELLWNN